VRKHEDWLDCQDTVAFRIRNNRSQAEKSILLNTSFSVGLDSYMLVKVIAIKAWTGPRAPRGSGFQDLYTAPSIGRLYPQEIFLVEAKSAPGS
jgi:hypothetical protein